MTRQLTFIVAAAVLATGCKEKNDGPLEDELAKMTERQEQLERRIATCEAENMRLGIELERKTAGGRDVAGVTAPATNGAAIPAITPEFAEALAGTINKLVSDTLDERIDRRISLQVGTPEDIEEIFSEVVKEEIDEREDRERREHEQRWRGMRENWYRGQVDRMASLVEMDEAQKQNVYAVYTNMRDSAQQAMQEPFSSGSFDLADMEKNYEKIENDYRQQIKGILTEKQYETYVREWLGGQTNMSFFPRISGGGHRGVVRIDTME